MKFNLFKNISLIKINTLNLLSIFREWFKVRKMFCMPSIGLLAELKKSNTFIGIDVHTLAYDMVEDKPVWKENPHIVFDIFFFFHIVVELCNPKSDDNEMCDKSYWEAILIYIMSDDIVKAYVESIVEIGNTSYESIGYMTFDAKIAFANKIR